MKTITWKSIVVSIEKVKPTPTNYKIKNALGQERLKQSLTKFGIAGTVVCNTDFTLIDGNSRLEEEKKKGSKKITVSIPDRKLSPQEFKEMSAMFDFAKAGEVDIERIQGDLGSTKDFYKNWNIEPPFESLGAKAVVKKDLNYDKTAKSNGKEPEPQEQGQIRDICMVQLFFSDKEEEAEFRKMEERLMKKFKTSNTTKTVLAAYKSLVKK